MSGQQINRNESEKYFFFFFFFPLGMQEVCKVQPSQNITEENVPFFVKDSSIKNTFIFLLTQKLLLS